MTNLQIYWLVIVIFAFLFAKYAAISNSARDWVRILLGQKTVREVVEADKEEGVDSSLVHYIASANENQNLRDLILPLTHHTKNVIAMWGGMLFILSGFFWVGWYWPLVALPLFILVLPRFFIPLVPGRKSGFKTRFMMGLDLKIEAAHKFDGGANAEIFQELKDKISATPFRR